MAEARAAMAYLARARAAAARAWAAAARAKAVAARATVVEATAAAARAEEEMEAARARLVARRQGDDGRCLPSCPHVHLQLTQVFLHLIKLLLVEPGGWHVPRLRHLCAHGRRGHRLQPLLRRVAPLAAALAAAHALAAAALATRTGPC